MAFVSGSGWLERKYADGLRKCLADEYTSILVVDLKGNINKSLVGATGTGEGANVFGQGSKTGIAITVFIKNPSAQEQGRILFHEIGDNLDRKQKLHMVKAFGSVRSINEAGLWTKISPDEYGDWIDQRDSSFEQFQKIGDKKDKSGNVLFGNYSLGIATGSDAWCINPSQTNLAKNIESTIDFFNEELSRWRKHKEESGIVKATLADIDKFVNNDPTRISWTRNLKQDLQKEKSLDLDHGAFVPCLYRPFTKQRQFFSRRLNQMVYQMPRILPNGELPNRVIVITGKGEWTGFSALMTDALTNLHTIRSCQCFPIWLYEKNGSFLTPDQSELFAEQPSGHRRRDAITEYGLKHFQSAYPDESIGREDIFHYIYGLLHSIDYRERYRANLAKELPRIPCVKSVKDFRMFRDAGKRLGELHVGYESVDLYPAEIATGGKALSTMQPKAAYRVTKMKHPGSGRNKDRTTVIYNPYITIRNIPEDAWDYVVNGKPALQWVMLRQCVKTHKASGIVSDANRYAIETVGDPRYPLDLFLRVITVSLETMKIVRALPELRID